MSQLEDPKWTEVYECVQASANLYGRSLAQVAEASQMSPSSLASLRYNAHEWLSGRQDNQTILKVVELLEAVKKASQAGAIKLQVPEGIGYDYLASQRQALRI